MTKILWTVTAFLSALLLAPIAALALSWLELISKSDVLINLSHMMQTVLPSYALESLFLCLMVGVIVAVMGTSAALLVSLFEFRGRLFAQWSLLLPLAMPAYVVAYAYTDFLQFSGPLQTWLRDTFSLSGRLFPDIRNVVGAAFVLSFCLYPYVYLLVRTALSERALHLVEAAKLLGASPKRRLLEVVLPLARPAIAAGVILVLMESLADFGVVSYFAVQTFTAGVYKAWLAMDDKFLAAQLATVLLVVVVVLMKTEQRIQAKLRFVNKNGAGAGVGAKPESHNRQALPGTKGLLALLLCLAPTFLGFFLPLLIMLSQLAGQLHIEAALITWQSFFAWSFNSLHLGLLAALLSVTCALLLAFAARTQPRVNSIHRMVSLSGLGYAVPGAVIVVGLLTPLALLQNQWLTYLVTATSAGLLWAYAVRFNGVALQTLQSGYARIPSSLDESNRLLGGSYRQLLRHIHGPLLKRSVLTAALLVFVDVMKELPATLVLRPFNTDTLAVVTYNLARDERLAEASLPALALVLVGLVPVLLLNRHMTGEAALDAPSHVMGGTPDGNRTHI